MHQICTANAIPDATTPCDHIEYFNLLQVHRKGNKRCFGHILVLLGQISSVNLLNFFKVNFQKTKLFVLMQFHVSKIWSARKQDPSQPHHNMHPLTA